VNPSQLRAAKIAVVIAILVAVCGLFFPMVQVAWWVGHTDLLIEFIVSDADTGEPIPNAKIQIHSEGGLCEEREKEDFQLVTGSTGKVQRLCRQCMCFGTRGWNIDTFEVHLPWWSYRVSAPGYVETVRTELDVQENVRRVQRLEEHSSLVVLVQL
jgi:hypothetical protein